MRDWWVRCEASFIDRQVSEWIWRWAQEKSALRFDLHKVQLVSKQGGSGADPAGGAHLCGGEWGSISENVIHFWAISLKRYNSEKDFWGPCDVYRMLSLKLRIMSTATFIWLHV